MISQFRDEYAFLSNYFPSPILVPCVKVVPFGTPAAEFCTVAPTVEHAFQARKTDDLVLREKIATARTAGTAKRMGREVILPPDWEVRKTTVMWNCLVQKFTAHPELMKKLVDTSPKFLVEGNSWHDNYWGVCICGDRCENKGRNVLGKFLMLIRDAQMSGILPQVHPDNIKSEFYEALLWSDTSLPTLNIQSLEE